MAVLDRGAVRHFLVFVLIFCICSRHRTDAIKEYVRSCGQTLNLENNNIHSGVLRVGMPSSFAQYQNANLDSECEITIYFTSNLQLSIELYYVDIVPKSNEDGCSTGLEVIEQSGMKSVYGGRVCMEGWKWEQKHQESKQEKRIIKSSPAIFRLTSEGPYTGTGFKAHFNEFRPTTPCFAQEFRCREAQRCIHDDLMCDGWDDCGDKTDEWEEAGCGLLTASEIGGTIIASLLFIFTVSIGTVFFITFRRRRSDYYLRQQQIDSMRCDSKTPIAHDNFSLADSTVTFPRRYASQSTIGKSGYSVNRFRGSNDSIDKMDLESGRFSVGSSLSKRERRKKMKQGLIISTSMDRLSERTEKSSKSKGRDRRSTYRDSASEYSDDDYEREKRRRRRSRTRSPNPDDYSDESEYEREKRRRRRKRRSYYSSDEDSDSEYERERRRRRRRRRRSYSDSDRSTEREDESDGARDLRKEKEREAKREKRRERDRKRDAEDDEKDKRRRERKGSDNKGLDADEPDKAPEKSLIDKETEKIPYKDELKNAINRRSHGPLSEPEQPIKPAESQMQSAPPRRQSPPPPRRQSPPPRRQSSPPPRQQSPPRRYSSPNRGSSPRRPSPSRQPEPPVQSYNNRRNRSPRRESNQSNRNNEQNNRNNEPPPSEQPPAPQPDQSYNRRRRSRSRENNLNDRSRDNITNPRNDEPATPPRSEQLPNRRRSNNEPPRQRQLETPPAPAQPAREYRRRSSEDRRGRRRNRDQQNEEPPDYEEVMVPGKNMPSGFKEEAV